MEAHLTLQKLAKVEFGGRLLHLAAAQAPCDFQFVGKSDPNKGAPLPKKATLSDVWGKKILSFSLPPLFEFKALSESFETLPSGLEINRTQRGESGVTVTFSDGSDQICQGVLFCDGPNSDCRKFWDKPVPAKSDGDTVQRWTFLAKNLLNVDRWDFRWATAKSVELVPLSEERLYVKLRFKSRHGSNLSTAELADLFSEFGSDMTALFENVTDSDISQTEETAQTRAVHRPAPGCFALGRAAWSGTPFLTFDWLGRFVEKELDLVAEQLRTGTFQEEALEAQARELQSELSESELYFRRWLHSDNTLLNPIRNLLLSLLPNAFLSARVRKHLYS